MSEMGMVKQILLVVIKNEKTLKFPVLFKYLLCKSFIPFYKIHTLMKNHTSMAAATITMKL